MLDFARMSLRKYRVPALVCAGLAAACAFVAQQAVPDLYPVSAEVLVVEPVAVHRLANPFAAAPSSEHELDAVPEILKSRERLVAIIKRIGLIDQWDVGRPWPLKLKDRLIERLVGPMSEADRLDALVGVLDKRLFVGVENGRVKVTAEWPSADLSLAIVQNTVGALTQLRTQREGESLDEAAAALDRQLESVRTEMNARAKRVEGFLLQGAEVQAEGEREQLLRESTRAAELLVAAEQKHITAEVFRQSNELRFMMVRPPIKPREPAGLPRPVRSAIFVLAALWAGLWCTMLLSGTSGRLWTPGQAAHELELPLLATVRPPGDAHPPPIGLRGWLTLLVLGVITGAAAGLTRGNPLAAFAPPLLFIGAWQLWTRPLKWPLLAVMLLAITLDDPGDRAYFGLWQSPLWPLGKLFFRNIALFTGVELCVIGLFGLMVVRRLWFPKDRLARIDPVTQPPPRVLMWALMASAGFIGWLILWGVARGGVFREALWQFRHLLMLPFVASVAIYALDIPKDLPKLLAVLVAGSTLKSVLGIYFWYAIAVPMGEQPPHTTGHADTMIFVTSVVTALTLFWEKASRRHLLLLLLWMPFVAMALKLNDRRIAYVDIVMAAGVIYLLSPMHEMKFKMTRFAFAITPLLLVYTAVGWNQTYARAFAPVQKVRSIIAPAENTEEESSNVERDIENYNLMKSWEQNMVLGQGFGHAFTEYVPSNDFAQSAFGHIGHNSILWLLWIGGIVGFTGIFGYIAVCLFFAGRTLMLSGDYRERTGLLVGIGIIVTYLMQAFGDMGTQSTMFDFFLGSALAITGRLATKHAAWAPLPERVPAAQGPEAISA
jgi:hypothetical protein